MTDADINLSSAARRELFEHFGDESLVDLLTDDQRESIARNRASQDLYPRYNEYQAPDAIRRPDQINDLLEFCRVNEVNDVKFGDGEPVTIRVHGKIYSLTTRPLGNDEMRAIMTLLYSSPSVIASVQEGKQSDCGYSCVVNGRLMSRWRVCISMRGVEDGFGFRIVCRQITSTPPTIKDVYLQQDIVDAVMGLDRGLMLVTGPTGSGKSTTLAALIRHRAESLEHSDHIITIENPIEFLHRGYARPFTEVTQWEVPRMMKSFPQAIEAALRCDPDLVLVGEMRNRESSKAGLEIALTGHGCFSTLHTNSVVQTVTRFLQNFSQEEIPAVQYDLVDNLHMIVSQLLRPSTDGRRVALRERLSFDGQIKDKLRSSKNLTQALRQVMESHGRLMLEEAEELHREGRLPANELERIRYMDMKERTGGQ